MPLKPSAPLEPPEPHAYAGFAMLAFVIAIALLALCARAGAASILMQKGMALELPENSPLAGGRFPTGLLQANCYVVYSKATRKALVVDPGDRADRALKFLDQERLQPVAIVATHAHFDHIFGTGSMKAALASRHFPDVQIMCHEKDAPLWAGNRQVAESFGLHTPDDFPPAADVTFDASKEFDLGDVKIRVMHTPGHSPGSVVLYCKEAQLLITGDTLFANSVGRTDLPGGSSAKLKASVAALFRDFPRDYTVCPGHGDCASLGAARHDVEPMLPML